MKFAVPTNWRADLIGKINKANVYELYGKLTVDFVGGGRVSASLPVVSRKQAGRHVLEAHNNGLKFNYLLNANCLNNAEWTIRGQDSLTRLIDWLVDINVDSVTVCSPYLLELIKRRYPKLKVYISTLSRIDSVEKAKFWESLGADEITPSFVDINRNFRMLKKIREGVKCGIKLIANLDCLYQCPFFTYHANSVAHASQSGHQMRNFLIDYYYLTCDYKRIADPEQLIRSGWIRPEDLHYYEDIGIDKIKLLDRRMTTEQISFIVDVYTKKGYDGNLLDLFPHTTKTIVHQKGSAFHKLKYFFRPFLVNVFKLAEGRKLFGDRKIFIDNRKLDGFLDFFLKEDCDLKSCDDCGYCKRIAAQAIKIDTEYQRKTLQKYSQFRDGLISGRMFEYI